MTSGLRTGECVLAWATGFTRNVPDHRFHKIKDVNFPTPVPMPLQRRAEPFDDPAWLFELKYDGFRALAHVGDGRCTFASRNGHRFGSWLDLSEDIGAGLHGRNLVLDGEIVCLDERGHPQFNQLLFRRGTPYYIVYDLLYDGRSDRRYDRLMDRKQDLKALVGLSSASRLLYADHIEGNGTALFDRICELDLEGIVAKYKYGPYVSERERSTWFKIRNRTYSQWAGRDELFECDRHREPVPGWHSCDLACEHAGEVERKEIFG